jgi:hypothetical protein
MRTVPAVSVEWNGRETVALVSQMIAYTGQIRLWLPPECNHALFHRLHPEAGGRVIETVDRSGDPDLLKDLSGIEGLEDLALIVDMLHAEEASVQIVSPPQVIIRIPGALPPAA